MLPIVYHPIGVVKSSARDLLRPEQMRAVPAQLVLERRFAAAVATLSVGQPLWVLYHLHRIEAWRDEDMAELFARRGPRRPNPIALTLVHVTAIEGSTITVEGLDAADGSPVLDLKAYRAQYDAP